MRSLKTIRDEYEAKTKEMGALPAKVIDGTASAEEVQTFRRLNEEQTKLYEELRDAELLAEEVKQAQTRDEYLRQSRGSVTDDPRSQPGGEPNGGQGGNGNGQQRYRSLGEAFFRSEQMQNYRRTVGMGGRSERFVVGSLYRGQRGEIPHVEGLSREAYALITSTTVTAAIEPQRVPGILDVDQQELRVRALFQQATTTSNSVEFVRRDTRTNNAAEVAEATNLSTGLKPESGFTLSTDSAPVRTIAHIMYATRQALDDMGQLRAMIDGDLILGIDERVDRQLLLGNGVAPNLKGLLEYPIQVDDAAYWGSNPMPGTPNKWDALRRAIRQIRENGGRASGIVLSPASLEEALTAKDSIGRYLFPGGGPFGAGIATMWNLPVTDQPDLDDDQAIVFDRRVGTVYDRMDAQIFVTDSNRDLFERNIITFLGEARLAFAVPYPEFAVEVDLASVA